MATRKRKNKPNYAAVIGLVGAGKVSIKSAKSHLSDFIEAQDGEILWVLPHTADSTKSMEKVKDFLWDEDAKYALVSDGTDEDEDWEENAQTVVEVDEDPYAALVTEVAGYEAETLAVMFILDEEHDADLELLDAAQAEGLQCFDLASGVTELELTDVEDEPEEETAADEEAAEESSEAPIPDDIQKVIDKGNFAKAGEMLADRLGNDGVKDLAAEFGLEIKKGTWAKNIGKAIAEHVSGDAEEEPEAEVEVTEVEPEKPAKKTKKKSRAAADETVQDVPTEKAAAMPVTVDRRELVHLIASVASAQGVPAAKEFYKFIQSENLVG